MPATDLGPLDWRIAITDSGGKPTPEFQRRWSTQRSNNDLIGVTLGTGAPTSTPTTSGESYLDTSTTPGTLYVSNSTGWLRVGVYEFTQLADVPNSYSMQANKLVQVDSASPKLIFSSVSEVLDGFGNTAGEILYRGTSTWGVLPAGSNGQILTVSSGLPSWSAAPATGVTSVGLSLPTSLFSVTGSPVTGSGTLTAALVTQGANTFFAGPTTGGATTPGFRSLVPSDLPQFTATAAGAVSASGGGTTKYLRADGTWDVPPGTGGTSSGMLPLVNGDINTPSGYDAYPGFILTPDGQCIGVSL